jgi:hypothetical protein
MVRVPVRQAGADSEIPEASCVTCVDGTCRLRRWFFRVRYALNVERRDVPTLRCRIASRCPSERLAIWAFNAVV